VHLRRLRSTDWLLAAGSTLLAASLFAPWFPAGGRQTAWQALSAVDVVLTLLAAVGVVAVALQATQRTPALPIVFDVAAVWSALAATVLVAVELLGHADGLCWGAWAGLAAALAMLAGAWLATSDERPGRT
jgi:hypothetical protein